MQFQKLALLWWEMALIGSNLKKALNIMRLCMTPIPIIITCNKSSNISYPFL